MGMAGDGLLSHDLAIVVPSALRGLTTVFGMGTGVAPARWSTANLVANGYLLTANGRLAGSG